MFIDNITDEIRETAKQRYPDSSWIFDTNLSKEEIIRLLLEEFVYWEEAEDISAFGALSNVIGKVTLGKAALKESV